MGNMERVHKPVLRRVHAHRGHNDTVGQSQILDLERLEQQWRLVSARQGCINWSEVGAGADGLRDVEPLLRIDDRLFLGERDLRGGHSDDCSLKGRRRESGGSRSGKEGGELEWGECD